MALTHVTLPRAATPRRGGGTHPEHRRGRLPVLSAGLVLGCWALDAWDVAGALAVTEPVAGRPAAAGAMLRAGLLLAAALAPAVAATVVAVQHGHRRVCRLLLVPALLLVLASLAGLVDEYLGTPGAAGPAPGPADLLGGPAAADWAAAAALVAVAALTRRTRRRARRTGAARAT